MDRRQLPGERGITPGTVSWRGGPSRANEPSSGHDRRDPPASVRRDKLAVGCTAPLSCMPGNLLCKVDHSRP
jgi:hypothetical protein